MPWNKDRKPATRGRIVEAAAGAIRTRGIGGIGVAEIMKAAGLTHGGFYAHFGSKDDLVSQAIAFATEESGAILAEAAGKAAPKRKLRAAADAYLSAEHFKHPEWGCPVAALGPELARDAGPAKQAYGKAVAGRIAQLEALASQGTSAKRRREAAGALAAMVGGVIVSRALGGRPGERYLAEVRRFLRDKLDYDD